METTTYYIPITSSTGLGLGETAAISANETLKVKTETMV
jgi:hypothetical protein